MGLKYTVDNAVYNMFVAFMFGSVSTVLLVYLLASFKILSFWPLLIAYIILIAVVLGTVYKQRTKRQISSIIEFIYLSIKGLEKRKIVMSRLRHNVGTSVFSFIKQVFSRPVTIIVLAVGLLLTTIIRYYFNFSVMTFPFPDVYVHAEWTKLMISGDIFHNGVYPFGMHNMMAALSVLFKINTVTVVRFFGCVMGIMVVMSVFLVLKYMFKTQAAIVVGFLIYTITSLVPAGAHSRLSGALPQEAGLVFLLPCAIFFMEYLRTKDRLHLLCLALCISQTVAFHFYIAIMAVILVLVVAVIHFRDLLSRKVFSNLALAALLAIVISLTPIVGWKVAGKPWEGSMRWALSVITGMPMDPDAEQETTKLQEDTAAKEEEIEKEPFVLADFIEKVSYGFYGDLLVPSLMFLAILTIFSIFMLIFKRWRNYAKIMLTMAVFSIGIVVFVSLPEFGLPNLIVKGRVGEFYSLTIGYIFASVVEILFFPLVLFPKLKVLNYATGLAAIAGTLGTTYLTNNFQPLGYFYQDQYDGAVSCYYDIVEHFEQNKFTIISSVDEVSMVRGHGWHYELTDFVYDLAEFMETNKPIYIPSDDLFIFIEKRPITPYRLYSSEVREFPPEEPVNEIFASMNALEIKEDVKHMLSAAYTNKEYRRAIMSKAWYWAQEYKKYFPNEMTVYYEDEDLIVYHLEQVDPYALYNLAIDYGYN